MPEQKPEREENGQTESRDVEGAQDALDVSWSGEDARRRGWFWHWNSIVTQYAPLIGLKGVGLLNSYTVWTDRREGSPLRGYAFPSQQAEADFYGEDRAELITINKILVALDLIEIRKQMVLRTDEQGRRWRVPHNLYRVKDHPEGYSLTPDDVVRVAALAARDRAVYRYLRRIFSPRFAPIDADNAWHAILTEVQHDPTWQQLAERTREEEARASARTKAGHARRRGAETDSQTVQESDSAALAEQEESNDAGETIVEERNSGSDGAKGMEVAQRNSGSATTAHQSNDGSEGFAPTIAEQSNEEGASGAGQTNRTYYGDSPTTTTTTGEAPARPVASKRASGAVPPGGAGPVLEPPAAAVACFEAANGREASPLERELLAELAGAFDARARRAGADGADWVVAAIREAVSSGSRFVAPKRVREILTRWAAEADRLRPGDAPPQAVAGDAPSDLRLPHGQPASETWAFALKLLAAVLDPAEIERLFAGSRIVDYDAGTLTVMVPSAAAAERLSGEYYALVSRKLSQAMRRPVRLAFVTEAGGSAPSLTSAPVLAGEMPALVEQRPAAPSAPAPARPPELPHFTLPGGLTNLQLWAAAQDELARRLSAASWEAWIRPAILLAREADGRLVLGVPTAFAQRRLSAQLRADVESVLADLLGQPTIIEVVVAHDWLSARTGMEAGA